jgi:hypothetical protein
MDMKYVYIMSRESHNNNLFNVVDTVKALLKIMIRKIIDSTHRSTL